MRRHFSVIVAVLALLSLSASAAIDVDKLNKVSSFVTAGGEGANFKRVPQKTFAVGDRLIFLTIVTWEPIDKSAGRHKLTWRWYSKGTLISEIKQTHTFKPTPFELWATMLAAALGTGEHKVEVLIDGKLFDTQEFSISE